jgi:hypothetical protein
MLSRGALILYGGVGRANGALKPGAACQAGLSLWMSRLELLNHSFQSQPPFPVALNVGNWFGVIAVGRELDFH